jgi:hypothetical protein
MNDLFFYSGVNASSLGMTRNKIKSFLRLERGWRYGQGEPFSKQVLDMAGSLNDTAIQFGFANTDAFPGKNGDVVLVAYDGDDHYEFRITERGSITFTHERGVDDLDEIPNLTLPQAVEMLSELKRRKWTASCIYTSATTTKDWTGLEAKPLKNQETVVAFPSSEESAFSKRAVVYANMPNVSMPQSLSTPSYFGNLSRKKSSKTARWSKRIAKQATPVTRT